jgi:nitroreductase
MTTSSDRLGLIFGRRSIRVYSPGEIDASAIQTMLEAAMAAPSAMTRDPWRFVVVKNPNTLAKLAVILAGGKMLSTSASAIVVCGDLNAALDQQLSYLLQDCSAATENLLLCAHALGIGACWVGVHPGLEAIKRVSELFQLSAAIIPMAVVALGHPGEELPPRTRFNADYVHNEKW